MLNLKTLPRALWAGTAFQGPNVVLLDENFITGWWNGTAYAPGEGGVTQFNQLGGDPLDNPALFPYLDGETGYCSGNNTITAAVLAHVTKLRVFYGAAGPVTFAADCASNGRVMLMFAEKDQPDFTVAFGPGVHVIQPPGTTLSSAESADRSVSWVCQVNGVVRVLSQRAVWNAAGTALVGPDGLGTLSLSEATPYVPITASGLVVSGACELAGFDCIVAAGNITIYDSLTASGTVIYPTTALVAGQMNYAWKRALVNGCYVVLSGAATVNVLVG